MRWGCHQKGPASTEGDDMPSADVQIVGFKYKNKSQHLNIPEANLYSIGQLRSRQALQTDLHFVQTQIFLNSVQRQPQIAEL